MLEIYATSIDYDPAAEASRKCFATIQNKMHWAAHGQTAEHGTHLLARAGQLAPRRADVATAKNYLSTEELDTLNRIVTIYLDFAELQARGRKPMYMADWLRKLDQFLQISEREILTHTGTISAEAAKEKAEVEHDKFRQVLDAQPSTAETHLQHAIEETKHLESKVKGHKANSKPSANPAGKEVGG